MRAASRWTVVFGSHHSCAWGASVTSNTSVVTIACASSSYCQSSAAMGTYCGRQAFIMGQLRLVMEERSGYHLERRMIGRSVVQDGETDRLHLNTEPAAQGSGYQVYADHLGAV